MGIAYISPQYDIGIVIFERSHFTGRDAEWVKNDPFVLNDIEIGFCINLIVS